ncbi:hypothetical protein D3C85_1268960 [compost metagenome]
MLLEAVDAGPRVTLDHKRTPDQDVAVGRRLDDEIAFWHLAAVTRREEQVLAALAPIRPSVTEIADVTEPEVVDHPQGVRRALHHDRTVVQVEPGHGVHALAIRCEEQRACIHQGFEYAHGAVVQPHAVQTAADGHHGCTGDVVEEGLDATHEVEVVVQCGNGLLVRYTVAEVQCAKTGFDLVRGGDLRGDRCRHLRWCGIGVKYAECGD